MRVLMESFTYVLLFTYSPAIVDNDHYEKSTEAADKAKESLKSAGVTDEQIATIEDTDEAKSKAALEGVSVMAVIGREIFHVLHT
jgi:hypothetical protein